MTTIPTADLATRSAANPIISPESLKPSHPDLHIVSLLNPGVFTYQNKTWLVLRVAECLPNKNGMVAFPVVNLKGRVEMMEVQLDDPDLISSDARILSYKGLDYLTTLSHFRFMQSDDGIHFRESADFPPLAGNTPLDHYGLEDCRVTQFGLEYVLTYTAVSENGVGVGMRTTKDWRQFSPPQMVFPPHNKDCALFSEPVNGQYYALHRPSSKDIGGNYIWLAESPDRMHWGNHKCILKTRAGGWDSERVGAGAEPIKTDKGWLEIYHGADSKHHYCLGAFLMDIDDPSHVISRSETPIMSPVESYELSGFFGHVVFTNGHLVNGDLLTIYYGASDEYVCKADFSINEILGTLHPRNELDTCPVN